MKQMERKELTNQELELLNSKVGLEALFRSKKLNIEKVLNYTKYEFELKKLQTELIKLQNWVINKKQKVVILFEGRDAAGKGGVIKRITQRLLPQVFIFTPDGKRPGRAIAAIMASDKPGLLNARIIA